MNESPKERDEAIGPGNIPEPRVLDAQVLFGGEKEVRIVFAGVCYRLRVTRRGRLILTK
jgi:hemin uptake protein HemP